MLMHNDNKLWRYKMEKDTLFKENVEIEILEFRAGGNSYGIIIEDIREILPFDGKLTPVPNSNPCIEGLIMPRDFLIPIVNLSKSLQLNDVDDYKKEMLIVTGIDNLNIAFHVDSVKGIHKVFGNEISKPGKKLSIAVKEFVVGVLERSGSKIEILDYGKIINYINPDVHVG